MCNRFLFKMCVLIVAQVPTPSITNEFVHWGKSSRDAELACGWAAHSTKECKQLRKTSDKVMLRPGEVYAVDNFLNAEEFAWLSIAHAPQEKHNFNGRSSTLGAVYYRVDVLERDLQGSIEELMRRIHGHAVLHIDSKSEVREPGWEYKGMYYHDSNTMRRYSISQSEVIPHLDTGTYGRCLSATLYTGQHVGHGGDLETHRCRIGNCTVVGWQYDPVKYAVEDQSIFQPSNLQKQASLKYKPGRLVFFLAETIHHVTPVRDYDRDILFIWFSCTPTFKNGNILGGSLALIRHLVKERADVNSLAPSDRTSPAYYAAIGGHVDILRLLHKAGASLDIKDNGERLAAHVASEVGHLAVIRYLSNHRANMESPRAEDGLTPLMVAAARGHVPVVAHLMQRRDLTTSPYLSDVFADSGHCPVLEFLVRWGLVDSCGDDKINVALRRCVSELSGNESNLHFCKRKLTEVGNTDSHSEDFDSVSDAEGKIYEADISDIEVEIVESNNNLAVLDASTWDVEQLCPEELLVTPDGKDFGFPLNHTHLMLRKHVYNIRVCEKRTTEAGGLLAIEGLLDVVGGAGGLKAQNAKKLDEEIVNLLGRDIVSPTLSPKAKPVTTLLPRASLEKLQHDRSQMPPGMYATMLTFLNDEEDGLEGGHTLFPSLTKAGLEMDARQKELSDHLHGQWDMTLLDHTRQRDIVELPGSIPARIAADMCPIQGEKDVAKSDYVAFKPRLGLTLLFWHVVGKNGGPYSVELGEHWHSDCGHNIDKFVHLRYAHLRAGLEPVATT